MSRLLVTIGLFLVLLFVGCSPKIERVYLLDKKLPSKPDSSEVKLFTKDQPPICSFEVIGMINSLKRNAFVSMEGVTKSLREEARKMGGDAVVGLELGHLETGSVGTNSSTGQVYSTKANRPMLQGTVIRWLDPICTK